MSDWTIMSEKDWEQKYRTQHGDAEYDRRLKLANQKANELDDNTEDGYAEMTIMRNWFRSLAMQATAEVLLRMEKSPARKWADVIYRVAGV